MKFRLLFLFLCIPKLCFAYYVCRPCCSWYQPYGWWGSGDYLLFWRKSTFFPPLLTTNPNASPLLSNPNTTILFGNGDKRPGPESGARVDGGMWLTKCVGVGCGGLFLSESKIEFTQNGDGAGNPIFGQPFFDVSAGGIEDVNLLSFPTLQLNGHFDLKDSNSISCVDVYARYAFLNSRCFRFDLIGGYIYNQIIDSLEINTRTTTPLLETVEVGDRFKVYNNYSAGLVGLILEWKSCNWLLSVTGKVGLGTMRKIVKIHGATTTTVAGSTTVVDSGFLAQPSNSGVHIREKFETASQIMGNLHLRIYSHLWARIGYSYLFWPAIDIASEQVNLNINPTQVPGPMVGPLAPIFHEKHTSYWVHGLSAGLYVRY